MALRPNLRATASSLARLLDICLNSSLGVVPHEKLLESNASFITGTAKASMGTKPAAMICHINMLCVGIV